MVHLSCENKCSTWGILFAMNTVTQAMLFMQVLITDFPENHKFIHYVTIIICCCKV